MNDLGFALRNELRAERDALIRAFKDGGAVRALLHGLSTGTDRLLRRIVQHHGLQESAAVIAVGGYGRGALFPHSDVDILILHEPDLSSAVSSRIEALIGQLYPAIIIARLVTLQLQDRQSGGSQSPPATDGDGAAVGRPAQQQGTPPADN